MVPERDTWECKINTIHTYKHTLTAFVCDVLFCCVYNPNLTKE